jgi:hypothetical protein
VVCVVCVCVCVCVMWCAEMWCDGIVRIGRVYCVCECMSVYV